MAPIILSCKSEKKGLMHIDRDSMYLAIDARRGYKDTLFSAIDSLSEFYEKYEGGHARHKTNGWKNLVNAESKKKEDAKAKGEEDIKPVSQTVDTETKGTEGPEALIDSTMIGSASDSNNSDNAKGALSTSSHDNGLIQTGSGGTFFDDYDDGLNNSDFDYNNHHKRKFRRWEIGGDAAHLLIGGLNVFGGYRLTRMQQVSLGVTGAWYSNLDRGWMYRFIVTKASYAYYFNKSNRLHGLHVGPYLQYGHYELLFASWENRQIGNFLALGANIGYRWKLPSNWALDLNLSLGYMFGTAHFIGPTDLNVRFAKSLKRRKRK